MSSVRRLSRHRVAWLALPAVVVALLAIACGGDGNENVTVYGKDEPVLIGIASVLSGDLRKLGEPMADAGEFPGRNVLIEGHRIEFVRVDSRCTAEGGAAAASELIAAGVVAVVGPACSNAVIASQPLFEEANITHISPSTAAAESTAPPGRDPYRTFFRMYYNEAAQGRALASFADSPLRADSAYLMFEDSAYGRGLAGEFRREFEVSDGEITGSKLYEEGAIRFASVVTSVVSEIESVKPDVVVFFGFVAEGAPLVARLREAGLDAPFLAADRVRRGEFLELAGDHTEGVYLSLPNPEIPPGAYDEFLREFDVEAADLLLPFEPYGDLRPGEGGGRYRRLPTFDASMVIIHALEQVAERDGDSVTIDRNKLNEAIRNIDIEGSTGHIQFAENGDNVGKETPIIIFSVQDRKFVEHSRMLGVTPY